jgi:hypothetical protein
MMEEVTAYLTAIGIPTVIDERALDDYGLGKGMPVVLNQDAIRTRDALDLLTHALDLAWGVRNGRLVITTQEGAEDDLITRVYDVRNLVELVPASYVHGRTITAYVYDFDSLIEVITSTIQPDSWDYVGGAGAIEPCYTRRMRTLVVAQTYGVHRQLRALLDELAKHGGSKPLTSATAASPPATADRSTAQPPFRSGSTIHASRLRTTAGRCSSN